MVDDDNDDSLLFREALGSIDSSLKMDRVKNGKEALDVLDKDHTVLPDILFVDINMPMIDGWQLLTYLKGSQKLKTIPVAIYTTSSHKSDIKTAGELGASYFISKPTDFMELVHILKLFAKVGIANYASDKYTFHTTFLDLTEKV